MFRYLRWTSSAFRCPVLRFIYLLTSITFVFKTSNKILYLGLWCSSFVLLQQIYVVFALLFQLVVSSLILLTQQNVILKMAVTS